MIFTQHAYHWQYETELRFLKKNWLIIENHQEACRLIMPTVRGTGMKRCESGKDKINGTGNL